jgi:hypothetical protein
MPLGGTSRPPNGREASEDTPPVGTAGRRVTFAKRSLRKLFRPSPTPRPLDGRDVSSHPFIGREAPIFRNVVSRDIFFEFNFFNLFLKKLAAQRMAKRATRPSTARARWENKSIDRAA